MVPSSPADVLAADTGSATAWITLVAALGGVVVTGIMGIATATLNQRWQARNSRSQFTQDQLKQLRQERREIYASYWSAWNRFIYQLRRLERAAKELSPRPASPDQARAKLEPQIVEAVRAAELEWREATNVVFLIGGQSVFDSASAHKSATEDRLRAAWNGEWADGRGTYVRLNAEMRRELIEPSK